MVQHFQTGALYGHPVNGKIYRALGNTVSSVVLQNVNNPADTLKLKRADLEMVFVDLHQHDHENYCCDEHSVHVTPHQACIFR